MAQRHDLSLSVIGTDRAPSQPVPAPPTADRSATAGEVLAKYLSRQATEFLRGLRLHEEGAGGAEASAVAAEAARMLRRSARRIGAALQTYRSLTDTAWADRLCGELAWVSGVLVREHAYEKRLERLLGALYRLSSALPAAPAEGGAAAVVPARRDPSSGPGRPGERAVSGGSAGAGVARAGALLERQLTLARTRAHSTALQALGSSRFHAVADAVAVLASEAPLTGEHARLPAARALRPPAELVHRRTVEAVEALPLNRARQSYNGEALAHTLAADGERDAAWNQVRLLVRLRRYAHEVLGDDDPALLAAGRALDRHRDAAEAAAAASAAARTPRIAPATAYALGVLYADQRHEVEAARFSFGRLWHAFASERGS